MSHGDTDLAADEEDCRAGWLACAQHPWPGYQGSGHSVSGQPHLEGRTRWHRFLHLPLGFRDLQGKSCIQPLLACWATPSGLPWAPPVMGPMVTTGKGASRLAGRSGPISSTLRAAERKIWVLSGPWLSPLGVWGARAKVARRGPDRSVDSPFWLAGPWHRGSCSGSGGGQARVSQCGSPAQRVKAGAASRPGALGVAAQEGAHDSSDRVPPSQESLASRCPQTPSRPNSMANGRQLRRGLAPGLMQG